LLPGLTKAYLALAAVCIIWSTTYLGVRIGVTQFPPFLFSLLRFLPAGLLLVAFMLTVRKTPLPQKSVMVNQAICGLLMVTLSFSLVGWAEVYISSGLAAIICSSVPVWVVVINIFIEKEKPPNKIVLTGLIVGMTGIMLMFAEYLDELTQPNYPSAVAVAFLSNASWASGSIWLKKRGGQGHPVMNAGLQMVFGALFIIPLTLLFDDYRQVRWSPSLWSALIYMSLVGSAAAYACYAYAIKKLSITIVSMYAYINPAAAVMLGWIVLNEKLNLQIGLAIAITLVGIYLVNRGERKSQEPPAR